MAKKEENPLFVGVTNGEELRRSMLECSKGILESLKRYEQFKNIREEKGKLVTQLKSDIKGVSRLINSLKTQLPKIKDAGIKKEKTKKAEVEVPQKAGIEKPRAQTEIEKLESELNDIESKLDGLG